MMTDALGPCPSSESLENIAAGQSVAPALREHVAACPACRERLQQISADNEFLAGFRARGIWPETEAVEPPGRIAVPGYDIVRELHRGGQGVVYQAVQRSTKRAVAIKVMREGLFATAADRARFAREIETLGRLNHPNIVAVHDAGRTGGLHYFVMDFVDGLPLDEALRVRPESAGAALPADAATGDAGAPAGRTPARPERGTSESERVAAILGVFVKICDAVHAAHLRGVMHRDLKPSNIRVDAAGEPHVLDFGLAKSVDEADPAMTQTGQFVGSLPWASPEQVAGASTIDLRTDVYSLGAMLFQLLTETVPFQMESSLQKTVDGILHRDPPRPRTIAAARGLRIDDDLETIVLKCLSKARERRYQGAGELAGDLRRYLAGEAIDAKRDSAWYVLRKTAWRKRRVFAAVAVPMLLFPFALYALHRSTLATRQAELERELRLVESARNAAMLELTRRLQARPGSPADSPGGRLSLLNSDALQNDLDTGSLPVSDHGVALVLAETLRDQGLIVEAEGLVRRALTMLQREHGARHPEVGRMRTVLAELLLRRGTRMQEAEQMAELAVSELRGAFGDRSPETARGWVVLASARLTRGDNGGALDAARQALAANENPGSIQGAAAHAMLARVHAALGEKAEARSAFLEALRTMLVLTHDTDARLLDIVELGATLIASDVLVADDVVDPQVFRGALASLAPPAALHEAVAILRGGADGTARDNEILPARLALIGVRERLLGTEHPSLGPALASAGGTVCQSVIREQAQDTQSIEAAVVWFRRAIPLQIQVNGADSPLVGKSYEKLGTCMAMLGRLHEAAEWFARDCELWMRQPPERQDDYQVLIRARWTAWHATRAGDYELGSEWTKRTLEVLRRTLGPDDGGAALVYACQALCLAELGRPAEARASDARATRILEEQTVPADQRTECGRLLGLARLRGDLVDEARAVLEPTWQAAQPVFERAAPTYRLEWSRTMLQYCGALGDAERAAPFALCIRNEARGDFAAPRADEGK